MPKRWQEGRRSVVMGLSGRILLIGAVVVFGMAFFWVHRSIGSITGSSIRNTGDLNVPIFEPGDEEPTANLPEADVPNPILVPAPTQTAPSEPAEGVADPQTSEAGEVALREPFAKGAKKLGEATDSNDSLRGTFGNPAGLPAEPILPQTKSPLSDSTAFESLPSENAPALSQGPIQPTAGPYTDDTLLPASPQTAPSDTPTSPEGTTPQPPPDPGTDTGMSDLPPEPQGKTTTSFADLPADLPSFAEDAADLE